MIKRIKNEFDIAGDFEILSLIHERGLQLTISFTYKDQGKTEKDYNSDGVVVRLDIRGVKTSMYGDDINVFNKDLKFMLGLRDKVIHILDTEFIGQRCSNDEIDSIIQILYTNGDMKQ